MLPGITPALRFMSSGRAAFSLHDLGNQSTTFGPTTAISPVSVPPGSTIVVAVYERSIALGSLADSAGNTYTSLGSLNPNADSAQGTAAILYAKNCAALSGGSITYTKGTSGRLTGMAAVYIQGAHLTAPVDASVTNSATGSSTTPSATSGAASVSGEIFIAANFHSAGVQTQDSANGWSDPFGTGAGGVSGGRQLNSGTTAKTFAPAMSQTSAWAVQIIGVKSA